MQGGKFQIAVEKYEKKSTDLTYDLPRHHNRCEKMYAYR